MGGRWFGDETYVKATGTWPYVYRAVDQHGRVIDVFVSPRPKIAATRNFFAKAPMAHEDPDEAVTDLAHALETVIGDPFDELRSRRNDRRSRA